MAPWGDNALTTTLYLLRHAKSSWADASLADHDRPLQDKGRRRAGALARWLARRELACDLVLCSTALRARQTLEIVHDALGAPETRPLAALYRADALALVAMLRQLGSDTPRVMVVGHDPVLQQAATWLAGTADGDSLDQLGRKYPTCALAMLTFGASGWAALTPGMGHLEQFFVPPDPPAPDPSLPNPPA